MTFELLRMALGGGATRRDPQVLTRGQRVTRDPLARGSPSEPIPSLSGTQHRQVSMSTGEVTSRGGLLVFVLRFVITLCGCKWCVAFPDVRGCEPSLASRARTVSIDPTALRASQVCGRVWSSLDMGLCSDGPASRVAARGRLTRRAPADGVWARPPRLACLHPSPVTQS